MGLWKSVFKDFLAKITGSKVYQGAAGEELVAAVLSCLDKKEYRFLNNVSLPYNSDNKHKKNTTQIDHIVFSEYGIFVIEVKNYNGFIVGERMKKKWIAFYSKNKKHSFQNPFQQNHKHLCAVQQVTKIDYKKLVNLVVFTGDAKFKNKAIKGMITHPGDLKRRIPQNYKEKILTKKEVIEAVKIIKQLNINTLHKIEY